MFVVPATRCWVETLGLMALEGLEEKLAGFEKKLG
jgi:hypothetical protein